jgi:hypothetical protein
MKNQTQPNITKTGFSAIAWTIDHRPDQVSQLVRKHGIDIPMGSGKAGIQKGTAALLTTSQPFRKEFADLFQRESVGFVGFVSATGDEAGSGVTASQGGSTSLSTAAKKTFTDTYLGKVLSPDSVTNWINTGLGIWASGKAKPGTNPANPVSDGIDYGRNAYTGGGGNAPTPASKGIGTTGIVLISVGGVALLGTVLYFALKKK